MTKYGESLKFNLVDIGDIESEVSRSTFDESALDKLADLIVATGCLLRPLIVKQINPVTYKVLDGHFEYHAAVLANKKDSRRVLSGMVSAFVVKPEIETTVLEQTNALKGTISVIDDIPQIPVVTESNELENRVNRLEQELARLQNLEVRMIELEKMVKQSVTIATVTDQTPQEVEKPRVDETIKQPQTIAVPNSPPVTYKKPSKSKKTNVTTDSSQLSDVDRKILEALNTWDAVRLVTELNSSGITPKIVEKVVSKRPFNSINDIKNAKIGIGPSAMDKIKKHFSK